MAASITAEDAAVADEDLLGVGIIDNRIGFLAVERDDLERLQRREVEHRDGVVLAVAGKAVIELRREGDAMHAVGGRDPAQDPAGVGIEHLDARAVGHVKAARRGIDADVIIAAFAADFELRQHAVIGQRGGAGAEKSQ